MEIDEEKEAQNPGVSLLRSLTSDLKGKQSVRTTFKLSERTISTVSLVAAHLGIKQKSLFDHLIDDLETLCSIAEKAREAEIEKEIRVQKTYVISRKSLVSLDQISKQYNAPRDALVEYLVKRLAPIIEREREKYGKRKEIFVQMSKHLEKGKEILDRSRGLLGDDPVHDRFEKAMKIYENVVRDIESYIKKGESIENF